MSINNENKNRNENIFLTDEKGRMDTMRNEAMKNNAVKNQVEDVLMKLSSHIKFNYIDLNTVDQSFSMSDSHQPQQIKDAVDTIRQALSSDDEIKEILSTVNDAVTSTLNDGSAVVNLADLKAFLNQAIPAWQNAMKNQIAFQQQHYQFPPRT